MRCGKRMYAIAALVLLLAVTLLLFSGRRLWDAEGVYAAEGSTEEVTEADTEGAASVSDDPQNTGDGETGEGDNVKIGTAFDTITGDVDNLAGDFILKYTFYNKSTGTDNWDNFVVEIRNDDYVWFDVRADNYGWLWFPSSGFVTGEERITFGNGASDWDVWADLMRAGQECTVYVIRQDTTVTVISQAAGDTFYAYTTLDEYAGGCEMYVHLTGESCRIENVSYTITYVNEWDAQTLADIEAMKAAADENNEGGASENGGATLDGTTLASTEWWTGVTGVELASESQYAVWNYTILVQSSAPADFGIEVYNEDGTKYITTLTNGDGWYYGVEGNDLVNSGESISDTLQRGSLYYVTVERQEDDFSVYYTDSSGEMLLAFFATDTNMDEKAYVHFYAEYGTFVVAATVNAGSSSDVEDTEQIVDSSETEVETESEEDPSEDVEDTEDVDENNEDDDDDDDDYTIEDLDDDTDEEDSEETEDDSGETVTIETASYSSQTWWSGSYGSAAVKTGDAVWVYGITVDKTYGSDAFSIEIYDGDGNYITLNSDGTAWYYGTTGAEIEVSGSPIVLEEGAEYIVTVIREGADFLVTFYDADGNELLSYYAADTDIAETAASHFYAQIGDFTVEGEATGEESEDVDPAANMTATDGSDDRGEENSNGSGSSNASVVRTGDVSLWGTLLLALAGMIMVGCASVRRRSNAKKGC